MTDLLTAIVSLVFAVGALAFWYFLFWISGDGPERRHEYRLARLAAKTQCQCQHPTDKTK
jgi:hypothetical protein